MRARHHWELALIGVCLVWGATFVVVQDAIERVPPFAFLAIRFALASLALALVGKARNLTRGELRAGTLMGIALFGGYAFQTVGLQYTSATHAGFLTGMFVVATPVIAAIVYRSLPTAMASAGVILAAAGLIVLAAQNGLHLGRGDSFEVLTAIAFAVHIVLIARLGGRKDAGRLALVQIATASALAGAWSIVGERGRPTHLDLGVWGAIVLTGILATAVAFFVQTRAQQQIPPTRTAVILTAEPVFAGIFGYLLAGDRIGWRGVAGAVLIIAGILVAQRGAPALEDV